MQQKVIIQVAEVVPLKQGLKLSYYVIRDNQVIRCRGSSIKTRIETPISRICIMNPRTSCRGSSIKTRIETRLLKKVLRRTKSCRGSSIKTRIETSIKPAKQVYKKLSCRGSSIKTRIETKYLLQFLQSLQVVAEVVPLKQGLKRFQALARLTTP